VDIHRRSIHPGGEASLVAGHVIRWADEQWNFMGSALNNGVNGHVNSLAVDQDEIGVYVGGTFTFATDLPAASLAHWRYDDGWREIGGGVQGSPGSVRALSIQGDGLYVGGEFQAVGGNWPEILPDGMASAG
jgi:hypothetical protein